MEEGETIVQLINRLYGLKNKFKFYLEKRLESNLNFLIKNLNEDELDIFLIASYKIISYDSSFKLKRRLKILYLDALGSYRGWRHYKGLPVRGQRTWSNGWSSFKCNTLLRSYKMLHAKKFYGNISTKYINVAYSAEKINIMWKSQWNNEWVSAKNSILQFKGHPSTMRIDLFSMSNNQIMHPLKLKKLSKKQKQSFKKNYFTLGFEFGFTRPLLYALHKVDTLEESPYKGALLVVREERKHRNASKNKITAKSTSKKIEKKKKSVWDY